MRDVIPCKTELIMLHNTNMDSCPMADTSRCQLCISGIQQTLIRKRRDLHKLKSANWTTYNLKREFCYKIYKYAQVNQI